MIAGGVTMIASSGGVNRANALGLQRGEDDYAYDIDQWAAYELDYDRWVDDSSGNVEYPDDRIGANGNSIYGEPSRTSSRYEFDAEDYPEMWVPTLMVGVGIMTAGGVALGIAATNRSIEHGRANSYLEWFTEEELDAVIRDANDQLRQELGLTAEEAAAIEFSRAAPRIRTGPRLTDVQPVVGFGYLGITGRF